MNASLKAIQDLKAQVDSMEKSHLEMLKGWSKTGGRRNTPKTKK